MQAVKYINRHTVENIEKGLYIISTPIGNLNDLSNRAKNILNAVDFIICENPNHSLKLLNNLGIKKKLFSMHDYNEVSVIKKINKFQDTSSIALISDAGSPLISDPGYKLVLNYIQKNINITTIPGPSAIISALQLSGLPTNNFSFYGFVPKSETGMKKLVKEIINLNTTTIFFVSSKRLFAFLKIISECAFSRSMAVCKEITKKNEKIFRGSANDIIKDLESNKNNLRGEFVVLIRGVSKKTNKILDIIIKTEIKKLLKKFSLTEVVEIVHKLTKISKKEIYKNTIILKND